jgi:hypothetical protein
MHINHAQALELDSQGFLLVEVGFDEHDVLLSDLAAISGQPLVVQGEDRIDSYDMTRRYQRSMTDVYGLGEFPLHSDRAHDRVPPRYLLLSVEDGVSSAKTFVLAQSGMGLSQDEANILEREVWRVAFGTKRFLTSIINDSIAKTPILRYDPCCMEPTLGAANSRAVLGTIFSRSTKESIALSDSQTLIIDNWRVFHGRSALTTSTKSRKLVKTLLKVDD